MDQSGDCVLLPENAQDEEAINFSYEIIVLDIYFSLIHCQRKKKEVKLFFEILGRPTLCSVIFVKRNLDSLLYSIALARSIKTRKG